MDDAPPPLLVATAQDFIRRATWIYAVTMPENPHWYVVRGRPRRDFGHEALFELIRDYHLKRRWNGRVYRSVDLAAWSYWIIEDGTVINRKPAHAAWDDQPPPPPGWLPDEYRRDLRGDERWWPDDPDSGVEP